MLDFVTAFSRLIRLHTVEDKIHRLGRVLRRKFHLEMIRNKGGVLDGRFGPPLAQENHGA